jgi:methyl-accepting chemotaxis protein
MFAEWQSSGLTVVSLVALMLGGVAWRLHIRNRGMTAALNNMSQGLCLFDQNQRLIVCNRQYLEMHKLSPAVVKPGSTLRQVIGHRKATGLFSGDVDQYCKEIADSIASGKSTRWRIGANDGRTVHTINSPIPGGGWVTTQEDITEQLQLQQRQDEIAAQQRRRTTIEVMIAAFRARMEPLLKTFGDSAAAMKSTARAVGGIKSCFAARRGRG